MNDSFEEDTNLRSISRNCTPDERMFNRARNAVQSSMLSRRTTLNSEDLQNLREESKQNEEFWMGDDVSSKSSQCSSLVASPNASSTKRTTDSPMLSRKKVDSDNKKNNQNEPSFMKTRSGKLAKTFLLKSGKAKKISERDGDTVTYNDSLILGRRDDGSDSDSENIPFNDQCPKGANKRSPNVSEGLTTSALNDQIEECSLVQEIFVPPLDQRLIKRRSENSTLQLT